MIRNAIGSLIALIGAAAAVWSTFLPWYGGREGKDFALSDLFTAEGISGSQPALLVGLFLPMLVAAILAIVGLLLRSRLVVALAALLVLAFAILWIVRQGIAEGSLTFGGDGNLDWGVGIAFASAAVLLAGAVFMAGRRRKGRGRHRGAPGTPLRRPGAAPAAGATAAGAGLGAGAAGMAAAGRGKRRRAEADEARPVPAAGTGRAEPAGAGASPGEPASRPPGGSGAGGTAAGPGERTAAGGPTESAEPQTGDTLGAAAAGGGAGAAGTAAAGRGERRETGTAGPEPGAGLGTPETTRPTPHTQPVTGSGEEAGTGRRAGAATAGSATGVGAGAAEPGGTGTASTGQDEPGKPVEPAGDRPARAGDGADAGMATFPRDERADRSDQDTRPPGTAGPTGQQPATGASPGEPAPRPLAGAGAGGPTRSGDIRAAEKGPDAMRPETRSGTAPRAESERKEPFPQRLLHRLQHAGHRGQHGPRGGDHRDAA